MDTNRQIQAEFIPAGSRTFRNEIHKTTDSISNKGELTEEWKESAILPIYKKDVKSECSIYRGKPRLTNTYKILSSIFLLRLTLYT
jgi:hypothetical protein